MNIVFATRERSRALTYIRNAFRGHELPEDAPELIAALGLIEKDIVRVGDPGMYRGPLPVFPGDNWSPEWGDEVRQVFGVLNTWALGLPRVEDGGA